MRIVDFIIYYTVAFHEKDRDGGMWSTPLARSVFLAGLNVTLWLFLIIAIFFHFLLNKNLIDIHYSEAGIIVIGVIIVQFTKYIYINKKRYEFITSVDFRPFTLSVNYGMALSFLIFILSFLSAAAALVFF